MNLGGYEGIKEDNEQFDFNSISCTRWEVTIQTTQQTKRTCSSVINLADSFFTISI